MNYKLTHHALPERITELDFINFDDLLSKIKSLCFYKKLDRVFLLILDDYLEDGGCRVPEVYFNENIDSLLRYLTMRFNLDSLLIFNNEILISLHECKSYETAYEEGLLHMEMSKNCYD